MRRAADTFLQLMNSGLKTRLFLLQRLPAAFFSGVRIEHFSTSQCGVSVPYNWFTKNPFRSTYFACLAMAAELSTGTLAMAATWQRKTPVSMLVVQFESKFYKKATGRTLFTCNDGDAFQEAVEKAIATGIAQTVQAHSQGRDSAGNPVADFTITWSFKART